MNIPGLKVLDEIIAGLPTNSAQRLELSKLRSELALKERKIAELEAKLAEFKPPSGVEPDAVKILKFFFEHSTTLVAESFADELGMKKGLVEYHFDKLRSLGFIRCTTVYGGHDIMPPGREFLVKNGLV